VATDLNKDNKPELITLNNYDSNINILENVTNGAGITSSSFSPKVIFPVGAYPTLPTDVAFDDIDGDGILDMIVSVYVNARISVFKGLNSAGPINAGTFAAKLDMPVANYMASVATGDIDGDGRPDILSTNNLNVVSVLRNNPVMAPTITAITPMSGPVGTTVTITGNNFNKYAIEKNVVYFGGAKAPVRSATETQIVVTVPAGSTYQPISVLNTETIRSAYSAKPFNVTYSGNTGIRAADFEIPIAYVYGATQYTSTDLVDIDNDGAPDMVNAAVGKNWIFVRRSKGLVAGHTTDQYDTPVEFTVDKPIDMIKIADFDGDGKADIAALSSAAKIIFILRNISTRGNMAFAQTTSIIVDQYTPIEKITLGDMDGDGKLDVVAGNFYSTFTIYRNISSTAGILFTTSYGSIGSNGGNNAQIGDIDGDGKPDLVYGYYNDGYGSGVYVARNTSIPGQISFDRGELAAENYYRNFKLADINGDDRLDIVLGGQIIFRNTATQGIINTSSFAPAVTVGDTQYFNIDGAFAVTDIDGDGKPDMAVANAYNNNHNTLSVFHNKASGTDILFDLPENIDLPAEPGYLAVADIDGDSYPDILVSTSNGIIQPVYYHPRVVITPPVITRVSTLKGAVGSQFTITGSGFSLSPAGNTVVMGNVIATVTAASATSLTVTVPVSSMYETITVTNNENKRVSNAWQPFVTTFSSKNNFSLTDFSDPVYIRTYRSNNGLVLADIDGDGKLDMVNLIDSNYAYRKMTVYRNISVKGTPLSAASFAPKVDIAADNIVAIKDINGDGKPDILSRGGGPFNYGGSFSVLANTSTPGNFSFAPPVYNGTAYSTLAVAAVDIDGDGLMDVVASGGSDARSVTVSQNISRDTPFEFGTEKAFALSSFPASVVVNDIDGDGKPDIITSNSDGGISVLRNTAMPNAINSTSFAPEKNFTIGKSLPGVVAIGDIDGDGKPDVIVTNQVDSTFCILRNTSTTGNISFAPKVEFSSIQLYRIMLADIDGDGRLDIITNQQSNPTKPTGLGIYLNKSNPGSFDKNSLAPRMDLEIGSIVQIAAGDLDGDGRPDLVTSLYGLNAIFANSPHVPAAPTLIAFGPVISWGGTVVTIKGTDFNGATAVSFGGTLAASFTVRSPGVITAIVASGNSGAVSVSTPLGTASLPGFSYGTPAANTTIITPLADVVSLKLGNTGTRAITLADVATVAAATSSPKITVTPASFNCATLGNQTVTVKVEDAGSSFNPAAVKFNYPNAVAFDAAGNLYVTEYNNFRIRKISAGGVVTTLAGNGTDTYKDGKGAEAGLPYPGNIAVDAFNNVYIGANGLRKIDAQANVTTLAGGFRTADGYSIPGLDIAAAMGITGLAVAPDGGLYVTDNSIGLIAKVAQTGVVTVFSGKYIPGGPGGNPRDAYYNGPMGVTVDKSGTLFIAESNANAIRKVTPAGVASTLSLQGPESFIYPTGIAVNNNGTLFIINGHSVASISADGYVKTIAGNKDVAGNADGQGIEARFRLPKGIALDSKGNIYVADALNNTIRKIDTTGLVSTFAGGEAGYQDGSIGSPSSITTAQVKVNITGALAITSTFENKLLPLQADGMATLPDYTTGVAVSSSCGTAGVRISQQPTAGTRLNAATNITVIITATDAAGTSISKSFIATADANKVVVLNPIPETVYGSADVALNAVPPTNSTVSYTSSNTAVATVVNNSIHITGAGTATITATSAGLYVSQATQVLVIKPAQLTVKADDKTRLPGAANPEFTYTYSGFVNSDKQANIAVLPTAATTATTTSVPGSYPITPGGAVSANYTFTYVPGILTISSLRNDNFIIAATGATCKGNSNGSIAITAKQNLSYTASITGAASLSQPFIATTSFNNLAAGTYNVCITIAGQTSYNQCFTVVISEPKDLSLYAAVSNDKKNVLLNLGGGGLYNIQLNGVLYTTTDSSINLPLIAGKNELLVTSDKLCQGIIRKLININDQIIPYPNPFTDVMNINLGRRPPASVQAEVYSAMGNLVYVQKFVNPANPLQLNLSGITMVGTYTLKLITDDEQKIIT
jgi:sugar lactone lactonase YvrE